MNNIFIGWHFYCLLNFVHLHQFYDKCKFTVNEEPREEYGLNLCNQHSQRYKLTRIYLMANLNGTTVNVAMLSFQSKRRLFIDRSKASCRRQFSSKIYSFFNR